jgi:SMC interacting uncharacterized protein involved in chromosome segregation
MRFLKRQNEKLLKENRSINETLQSTIGSLQSQMAVAMTTALKKKSELEQKLVEAENTIKGLSDKLAAYEDTRPMKIP